MHLSQPKAVPLDVSLLGSRGHAWRDWILDALGRGCSIPSIVASMDGPDWAPRDAREALRQGQAVVRLRAAGQTRWSHLSPTARRRAAERIFVSVAAYCEPHLLHTIADAAGKATRPENLVFGVVDQHPTSRREAVVEAAGLAEVRYLHLVPAQSRGVSWARSLAFSLARRERYLLQIDSHMLFEPDWDPVLLDQYDALVAQHGHSRHILSTYPIGFEFQQGRPVPSPQPPAGHVLVLQPRGGERPSPGQACVTYEARAQPADGPVRGSHLAAGFLFTDAGFIQEVPYDPFLYFSGEEHSLAMRAFTHGWDIWHPARVPLFHLYKQSGQAHEEHHWHGAAELARDTAWQVLDQQAKARVADLVLGRDSLGVYGLGKLRAVDAMFEPGWWSAFRQGPDARQAVQQRAIAVKAV